MEQGNELQRHKGGRPVKKVKRMYKLMVRLTDTERFLIQEKAREAGVFPSTWFREAAKRAKVVARLSKDDLQVYRMLAGMANNLNQITHQAHISGLLSVQRKCREILTLIDQTLKKLNSDDWQGADR